MLQPMHSRMSSMRPSSIFFGRKGSAMEGRAAPMKSMMPLADDAHHGVGRGIAAHPHHRLCRHRLDEGDIFLLEAFLRKARGLAVVRPVGDVDVPQVRHFGQRLDHVAALGLATNTLRAQQLVHRQAHGDRRLVAHRLARVLHHLAEEAQAVVEAAAIFVVPVIVAARQEVLQDRQVMAGIDVDDVEARIEGAPGGGTVDAAQLGDIGLVERARLHRIDPVMHQVGRCERNFAAEAVGHVMAAVDKLDGGEAAVLVHRVSHEGKGGNVAIVPQAAFVGGAHVGAVVDFHFLGRNHRPAALGLHAAHARFGLREVIARAGAMRHLIKAVARRHRPDPHRLEQNVIARIACHLYPLLSFAPAPYATTR